MRSKIKKHWTERFFDEKEINYAANKNPQPNFVMRIGKNFEATKIDKLGKGVVVMFRNEIIKLKDLINLLRP